MQHFYEKSTWTQDAKSYAANASLFCKMAYIVGFLGVIVAIIAAIIGLAKLGDGGLLMIINAIVIGFYAIMIIAFGSMMRGLCDVVLAIFEMTVSENRLHIYNAKADKTD